MKTKRLLLMAAVCSAAALPAQAALTTDLGAIGSPLTVTFDDFDGLSGVGPTQVGASIAQDVVFTASMPSTLGAFIADLGSNGLWGAGKIFAGTGSPAATGFGLLHYTFSGKVSKAAGAVLNSFDGGSILLIAYGASTTILEAHVVDVSTPGGFNEGSFFGITRPSADIRAIAFGGTGLVMDDLTFTTPVPEPGTWAMMLAGLVLVGTFVARRRRG
jgi:hypothetical protein